MKINNLAHLKQVLQPGAQFRVLQHTKHNLAGVVREVSIKQSNAVYTKVVGQPKHHLSTCNGGRGVRMDFEKASCYVFGDTVKVYDTPGNEKTLIFEIEVLEFGKEVAA